MPFPHHHLNHDKEEVISTLMEEVRHLRQELSSQTSKQQALETLMQRAVVELEEAKTEIMKLHSEIARSTSDDKMTITSLQNGLSILQNEIAEDSFKRAEEILKLEKKLFEAIKVGGLCHSQDQIEQIEAILLKNEVFSDQGLKVEHSLKADLQEVQNKLSALLKDKDSILPSGTPAQLVPILQQPVPSEMERKTFSTIDPTTDKETSQTELVSQSRTGSTSEVFDSFNKMDLKSELLHSIYSYGIERPTTLQQKAIVPCLKGNDIIVQAGPGTGKTTMYLISILQKIDTCLKECQAIVLVLDGKHAQQIQKRLLSLGGQMGAQCHAFIGGTNVLEDLKKLCSSGVHVVVGTPGRIFDMISRRALSTKYIKLLFLDEADEMLSRGFEEQIYDVFKHLSEDIQVIFFCDAMTGGFDVVKATKNLMKNPIHILIQKEELNCEGIKHFYCKCDKYYTVIEILIYLYNRLSERDRYDTLHITQAIIFCNDSEDVDFIRRKHGDHFPLSNYSEREMDQEERETIMRDFFSGSSRFLFTTDIRARPVDVQQVSLVINFDLPREMETYINRIVRCGRFGRKGVVLSFVTQRDYRIIGDIKRHYIDVIEVKSDGLKDMVDLL